MSRNRTENPNIASDRIDILENKEIFVFGAAISQAIMVAVRQGQQT